ncbi:hypothetical protein BXY66_0200 [Shimia isoporae]|uniref:DNA mimic protein DMP19 C-terminal domain-containing protein n=1 Tax=Shimia isoporae TaxID=647720 RepID=A0A4R1NIV3_9RHOB|nr:hypothetical protein [Shimia isoporae]TCL08167.1 hypothetical protein BXY66_0200 [Shimia isoporae]
MLELPKLAEEDLAKFNRDQSDGFILGDLYVAMFPQDVSIELGQLRTPNVVINGYQSLLDTRQISENQWIVFCASHLIGGIANGGVWEGLLESYPQLVPDCIPLLTKLGLEAAAEEFEAVFAPLLTVQSTHRRNLAVTGQFDLAQYGEDYAAVGEILDEERVDAFERAFEDTYQAQIESAAVNFVFDV